ncbi:MAG: CDP-alcohol phosphatidyltransferase family protein [Phycisphaerales bacterium]|nr:CDP-alcohol phosphatidyltransferase family protein [Phycisphaerales bacterium]
MPVPDHDSSRRPVKARGLAVMHNAASRLASVGVTPNAVSVMSVVFSFAAGALLSSTSRLEPGGPAERAAFLVAAALVALRLLANLLDGLIAVEGGKRTPLGGVFNELPDRLSDAFILIGFGSAAGGDAVLGFTAAIVSILIAYVRELGHGLGARHHFVGPMAKQNRMTLVILASCWLALTPVGWRPESLGFAIGVPAAALVVIIALGLVTMWRRLALIARDLRSAAGDDA